MLSRTQTIVAVVGAVVVMASGALAAQPTPGSRHWRGGHGFWGNGLPLRQLELSEQQREQVRTIHEQHQNEFRAIAEKLGPAREALEAAVRTVPVDEALIRGRMTELGAVETEAALLRARVNAEILQTLTPEQQEKLKALEAERGQRRADFRKRLQQKPQSAPAAPPQP